MGKQLKDFNDVVLDIYNNMNNIFLPEEKKNDCEIYDTDKIDETFLTAELFALFLQYKRLTDDDGDIIDFIHVLNKLAVQQLLKDTNNAIIEE